MALFGKDREREETRGGGPEAAPRVQEPAREVEMSMFEREQKAPSQDANGTSAFLGKGTRITGKLAFEGTVRIEGHVEGEISAQETLTIGESANLKAKITGTTIIVHGNVTGDITAKTRLELRAPSKVTGNINTPSLVIQEGAAFEGQCAMGGAATDGAKRGKKPDFSVLLRSEDSSEDTLGVPPETPR